MKPPVENNSNASLINGAVSSSGIITRLPSFLVMFLYPNGALVGQKPYAAFSFKPFLFLHSNCVAFYSEANRKAQISETPCVIDGVLILE